MAQNRQKLEIELTLNSDNLKRGIQEGKGDFKSYITSIKTALAGLPDGRTAIGKAFAKDRVEGEALLKQLREISKQKTVTPQQSAMMGAQVQQFGAGVAATTNKAILEARLRDIKQMSSAEREQYAESIRNDSRYRKEFQFTQQLKREEYKKTQAVMNAQAQAKKQELSAQQRERKQAEDFVNRSITLRYALYDVASSLQSASAAMLNYSRAAFGAAIAQQAAFSKIEKTQIGAPVAQLQALQKELVDLSTEIPRSFDELTSIGMLGAQLGIATSDIAKFTEVVAKFSTITGVTVEETALAFGKLASLLQVPADEFEKLGASIAQVGVNGASTEQQILSTAKQIGAVANAAGLSAGEVVGLASAMASLGIAPEEARGVLIPTFQQMDRAIRSFNTTTGKGSEALDTFAELAGEDAEDFVRLWSDKTGGGAYQVFEQFIQGLGNTDTSQALQRLGLDGIRTSKGLTALGNSAKTMGMQVKEAVDGFGEGTFLDESFATTLEDIASKLKMTQSAFEALLASFAGDPAALSIFGVVLDLVTMLSNGIRELVDGSRVGSFIFSLVSGLVLLGGLLTQLIAVLAVSAGGFLALRTAAATALNNPATNTGIVRFIAGLVGVKTASVTTAGAVAGVGVAGTTAGAGLSVGAAGARGMTLALRGLLATTGVGAVLLLLGFAVEALLNTLWPVEDATGDAADGVKDFGDETDDAAIKTSTLRSELDELLRAFNEVALAPYKTEQALYDLGAALKENGKGFDAFSEGGRNNMDALAGVVESLKNQANGDAEETYRLIWGFMLALEEQGLMTAEAYTYLNGVMVEFAGLAGGIGNMMPENVDIGSLLKGFKADVDSASGAVDTLSDKIDELFKKLDQRVSLFSSLDGLKQSLIDNGAAFSVLSEGGRNNIEALRSTIDELAEASGDNERKFTADMKALRIAMQNAGVGGKRAFGIIDKAIKSTGVSVKAAKDRVKEFSAALRTLDAERVIGVADAIERLSSSVMNYLNARWMLGNTQMEIASGWESIANEAANAREEVEDISDEIAGFAADRGILEYQLGIALKYGDTLRANELRAQIAELNQREANLIAENQAAREEAAGNTTPAADLLSQQQALQNIVGLYVQEGAAALIGVKNKKEAKGIIQETVEKFKEQAREAGVSEENVKKYAKELRIGLKLARDLNKPAEYKINARTEAALQQIRNFRDSANAAINAIRTNLTFTASTAFAGGGPVFASRGGKITGPGSGTSDSIPAMLSNGEYVMRASAVQAYGLGFMNSLNNMTLRSSPQSSSLGAAAQSSSVVYLSPEDRSLLRAAIDRPINLYTDNAKIAQSANSGNVLLAQRGLN